jgi:hypothetical protein
VLLATALTERHGESERVARVAEQRVLPAGSLLTTAGLGVNLPDQRYSVVGDIASARSSSSISSRLLVRITDVSSWTTFVPSQVS